MNNIQKRFLIASFLLFNSFITIAQDDGHDHENQLHGQIFDLNDQQEEIPLVGANVYWLGTQIATSTDIDGQFIIDLDSGNTQLVVSYVGYMGDTLQIDDDIEHVKVVMKGSTTLKDVEVIFKRKTTTIDFLASQKTQNISSRELQKAACCNLAESFETTSAVDVTVTDAVTGTRQIEMLGLAGKYTQITRENMPGIRGLSSNLGLTYVPGSWISSIQIVQGMGQVSNGYESITGQINVEYSKPMEEQFFVNVYGNQGGRTELNMIKSFKLSNKVSTAFLMHGSMRPIALDHNHDGFMDFPLSEQVNIVNRWKFNFKDNWMGQIGVNYVYDNKTGGQSNDIVHSASDTTTHHVIPANEIYSVGILANKGDIWAKSGFIFENKPATSLGFQASYGFHDIVSNFGNRMYTGSQRSGYGNIILQSTYDTSNHKYRAGASFQYDQYDEVLDSTAASRTEAVPGVFYEHTYTKGERFTLVAGLRFDYHNLYGLLYSPRVHMRYEFNTKTVMRLSAGRGYRTSNIFAENLGLMASNRIFLIQSLDPNYKAYGLDIEVAHNYGISLTRDFKVNYKEGYVSVDFFRTEFQNQIVVDVDQDPRYVFFYNLAGKSFSNSFQAEVNYEVVKQLDVKMAYRFLDVKTDLTANGLIQRPLVPQHRAFINAGYETRKDWKYDLTVQWIGEKRIPFLDTNPIEYQFDAKSPSYFVVNCQITKTIKERLDLYVGVENLLNFRQYDAILSADVPSSQYFDASMVWGPIFGRMVYGGVRFNVKK